MKLRKLKEIIDKCVERAGDLDPDVEVWLGEELHDIKRIGQFGMIPDVTIHLDNEDDED